MNTSIVGESIPRLDGLEKALGRAKYLDDIELPNMIYGRVLRSKLPHARIVAIDYSKAEKINGVLAIITAKDIPINTFGLQVKDQPVLAERKVRFIGEGVAAVAAETEEIAAKALEAIKVDYETLPAVFDPIKALQPDAPKIHDKENLVAKRRIKRGDVKKGFEESFDIAIDTFSTQKLEHSQIEPHGCIAEVSPTGDVTVWTGIALPFIAQTELARVLSLPTSKIKVLQPAIGGGFGGRSEISVEPIAILLAKKSGRPVKVLRTREEEFTTSTTRHSYTMEFKSGFKKDGMLIARQVKLISDTGAYLSLGEPQLTKAAVLSTGPYNIPNIEIEGNLVYTNNVIGGAMRGFGAPQVYAAEETHMDNIAIRLGIDPMELRIKNALDKGDCISTGQIPNSVAVLETIKRAADSFGWTNYSSIGTVQSEPWKKRGIGMASMIYPVGVGLIPNFSSAIVKVHDDGTVNVISGASEVGQGSTTVLCQIAAEELGVPVENVKLVSGNTEVCPFDYGAVASRTTYSAGNAVRYAAQNAKKMLFEVVAEQLSVSIDALRAKNGRIYVEGIEEKGMLIMDAVKLYMRKGRPVIGLGTFNPSNTKLDIETGQGSPFAAYIYATQMVEVEVDTETGIVRVLRVVAAHDAGKVVNPTLLKGQILGGVAMGIGQALMEDMVIAEGKVMNPNFLDYLLPTASDIPKVDVIKIEEHEPTGPYGAKGVAEPPNVPTTPAIINAIRNATGAVIRSLPATPERVLKTLNQH